MGSGRHTDRVDAARLAKMAALGIVPTVWVPPQPMRQVRRLLKTRERLDSQRRALLNQARAALGRHGDRLLRRALIEAAWSVARHDEGELGRFFRRKAAQLGTRKALVALARKLLIVAWRILRTGEPYRAQKPRTVQRKL
ncbi:MAG TPA: hypothetical protein VIK92_04695, partial [Thermaerobacter sp.]